MEILWNSLKAKDTGYQVFSWEAERVAKADPDLLKRMEAVIEQSTTGKFAECGIQIHELINKAFNECQGDIDLVPEWFVDNLPKIKPNIAPMAIRHARHIGDMLANYHVQIIGVEVQIDLIIVPETETTPAVIATTRIDLLGSGKESIHVVDFKTGFKRRSNSETVDSFQAQCISLLLFGQEEYKEINTIHFWFYETMFGTKAYAKFERNEEHPRLPGLTTEVALKGRVEEAVKLFVEDCRDAWPLEISCLWCDVIKFCPQASMEAKEIADDPKAFVDNLVVLDALVRRRKKAATAWIKGHGPLEGSKVIYTQKVPQEKFTAGFEDKAQAKGLLETGNPELDSHFTKG